MARRVDKIQGVFFTILSLVGKADSLALYGDSPLAFDIHIIEELVLEFSYGDESAELNHSIRQGRFAVVYVRYYTEIAYVFHYTRILLEAGSRGVFTKKER
jgi:hypothetical protein